MMSKTPRIRMIGAALCIVVGLGGALAGCSRAAAQDTGSSSAVKQKLASLQRRISAVRNGWREKGEDKAPTSRSQERPGSRQAKHKVPSYDDLKAQLRQIISESETSETQDK